ncbi:MAG TPA: HPr-rel-A system PqqD family peptide chaperone [Candidatus Accumulibacter phosphatis]|nr:HPr-rel-A system PqqD family peptide chaperone [Accumulibacter sp.]HCN69382.1 HPr-rel-A system PqqD family peptide chaperone [Accumulibacter sp.]HCV14572.1 HPr-rel-A system PqqD family peptide chaperone [Accumulibacter sp.]HRL75656.1 HPr-rel-A system PqqD family peptide chaperone [Candidatus Accumulibacter phosphatis]HRQ95747.1 HPr-rel-A system PqqD family peptide chaperone [Candidatus Accumulibacter phosphatis]
MQPLYRRLGEGAVAFDQRNWQTHILTPAAALIFEALSEIGNGDDPVPMSAALSLLRDELEVDTDTPEMRQVLRSLQEMGILGG